MNKPLVSVIIPTYNRSDLLGRAVKSVLSQTFTDLEIVIVDDCSNDQTPVVVKRLKDSDPRIRYIRLKENQGGPRARNRGIREARGKYIGLLDDDDQWLPQKLKEQVKRFREGPDELGLLYGGFKIIQPNQPERTKMPKHRGDIFKPLLRGCLIGSPTNLVKRECFDRVGLFDPKLKSCQDWDIWVRIAKEFQGDYLDQVVAIYYLHNQGQISTDYANKAQGVQRIFEKHYPDLKRYPKILNHRIRGLVRYLAAADRKKEARFWQSKLLLREPLFFDHWKGLFRMIFDFENYKKLAQRE